jgi:hypothetical protein
MNQGIGQAKSLQSSLGGQMRKVTFVVTLAAIILSSVVGRAQTTASAVNGTVTDSSGAIIVGAGISVVNTATGVVYHTTTDDQGSYHVRLLPPGSYTLEVAKTGFETQKTQPFTLLVDQQLQQNIALAVGELTQTISVSAAALLLGTGTSNEEQVIQKQQIDDIPLNGRDYLQLAQLSAGVTPIVAGMPSMAQYWTGPQTVALSIGGMREDDASYLYDGIETRNAWYGGAGLLPSPDFIQEFDIKQSAAPASYGVGGAFIDVVTRSGSNQFHGTAFEFVRNNDFDARNFFDIGAAPPFRQNQFGGSVGGPIKKNKMFFFANYEGFRQIQPTDTYNNVPTAAQLAGDFSADTQQLVNPLNNYLPFQGNKIPSQYFNAIGQKILAYYPPPTGSYPGGLNHFNISNWILNWDQENGRFDYAISGKDSVFVRFTNQNQTGTTTGITPAYETIWPSDPKNLAVEWTHVFSPHVVNNFRYGWSHTETGVKRADGYNLADANPLGLVNADNVPGSYGPPSFGVTNYANPGSWAGTQYSREGMSMVTESLMLQKGRHQITTGLDIRYQPIYVYEDWAAPSISFNGSYTGDPIADVLLGVPTSTFAAVGSALNNFRMTYQAYYVQDHFQLNRRLSLDFGGRWEYAQPPYDTANRVGSFDIATNQDLTYPDTKVMGLGRAMTKPQWTNIAPRVGFSWAPSANGTWNVKGGFGTYYLQPNIDIYQVEVDTTQLYLIQGYNNSPAGQPIEFTLDQLYVPGLPGSGPIPSFMQPDMKTPVAYEWNLTIDHTIKNWILEAAYLGTAARHYEERPNIDPINPDGTFPFAGWAGVQEDTTTGSSLYNGLVARVERRYRSGFSFLGSYTYSKWLGMPWQDVFAWHPLDMKLDKGHFYEDLNQNLVANTIYELPFGRGKAFLNKGRLTDAVIGGWRTAAIVSIHSGPWETLSSSQNLGIFVNPLPNVTGPVNNSSLHGGLGKHGRLGPYFNIQNVQPVTAVGVQGNAGVQNIESPGYADVDMSLFKEWRFRDRYGFTLRGDAFNLFNRVNFYGLDTGVYDSTFGNVTAANPAREIQISLRITF